MLFDLTSGGDDRSVRMPVPKTTKNHSVLIIGSSDTDPVALGPTIFDAAHAECYQGYNAWARDATADIVQNLSDQRVLMLVNANAVDYAGQNLGANGYRQVVAALDALRGRLAERPAARINVPLAVTSDHCMVIPSAEGRYEHFAENYATLVEALRVPLTFLGPSVEELSLAGRWSKMDITPTVLDILNKSSKLTSDGKATHSRLLHASRKRRARGPEVVAEREAIGQWQHRGVPRGQYSLKTSGREWGTGKRGRDDGSGGKAAIQEA